jgi:hypothetical protein
MPIASTALADSQGLPPEQARAVARALLDGFDKHYALFRDCARAGRRHFEAGNWLAIQHVARDRIDFYDRRETADRIAREFRTPSRRRRRRDAGAGELTTSDFSSTTGSRSARRRSSTPSR